jgi:hypothetical protein
MGAQIMCTFGLAPAALMVLPQNKVLTNVPAGNIMDNKPFVNVLPFGMCTSPANPAVAAALGVPQPCTPQTPAPWIIGKPTVLIGNMPALDMTSKLMCIYGGMIQILNPGQVAVQV